MDAGIAVAAVTAMDAMGAMTAVIAVIAGTAIIAIVAMTAVGAVAAMDAVFAVFAVDAMDAMDAFFAIHAMNAVDAVDAVTAMAVKISNASRKMKTEMEKIKIYVYARSMFNDTSIMVSSNEFDASYYNEALNIVSVKICEMDIAIPSISSLDIAAILRGEALDKLIYERERLSAEFSAKLNSLDVRINEMQAIEFKGEKNEQ